MQNYCFVFLACNSVLTSLPTGKDSVARLDDCRCVASGLCSSNNCLKAVICMVCCTGLTLHATEGMVFRLHQLLLNLAVAKHTSRIVPDDLDVLTAFDCGKALCSCV